LIIVPIYKKGYNTDCSNFIQHSAVLVNSICKGNYWFYYFILFDSDIPMKLVRLIKICLTEMYRRIQVAKNLSQMFSIRNGLRISRCSIAIAVQLCSRLRH
jgi:hypothetical protein